MKKIDTGFGFGERLARIFGWSLGEKTLARLVAELGANSRAFARVLVATLGGL